MTMVFGVLLLALGVTAYFLTDNMHPAQLMPAGLGVLLCLCGLLANTEDSGRRMLWMHVAVTLGLLGFLGSGALVGMAYIWAHGEPFIDPIPVEARGAMCLLCAIFVGLCVRSFIAARRARRAA